MIPTFLVGDFFFVSKYAYGYSHFSLPAFLDRWPAPGRLFAAEPKRGDIVVFKLPREHARPCSVVVDRAGNVWYADISGYVGMLPARDARE